MKKFTVILFLCITSFTYSQRKPKIKGSRVVVTKEIELPPFKAIELKDDLEIVLEPGNFEGVEINADDNLLDILKFEVEDSTLLISSFYEVTAKKKLDIIIRMRELEALTVKEGKVRSQGIVSTDRLYLNLFGASKTELELRASEVYLTMEDNTSGNFNIDTDTLGITLKDRVDAKVYSVNQGMSLQMTGTSGLVLEGTSSEFEGTLSGNTTLKGSKMEGALIRLQVDESSVARIYAYELLELKSSGRAKTYLGGNPTIAIKTFTDTSELHKVKD